MILIGLIPASAELSLKILAQPDHHEAKKGEVSSINLKASAQNDSLWKTQTFAVTGGCEAGLFWKTDNDHVVVDNMEACEANSLKTITLKPNS